MGASSWVQADLADFVEEGCLRQFVLLLHFLGSESSDEDRGAVPDDLQDLSRRYFRDIDLEIGISVIPCPAVESADDGHNV